MNNEDIFAGTLELKDFIENMPGGFFIYHADKDEKIIYANDITLDIFGCENFEEFLQLVHGSFRGLVYPSDYKKISHSIDEQVAESNRNLDYVEYRIIRKDGSIRYIDDYGRLVHTKEHGDVYYVFIRDVTEVYEERRENIRRAKVIEGLSVGFSLIFLFNLEKDIIKPYRLKGNFSKKLMQDLRLTKTGFIHREKWFNTYAERYIFPEDREMFLYETSRDRIVERIKFEPSYTVTYRSFDKHKNLIYIEMSVVSIEEENTLHVLTGFREVTEITEKVRHEVEEKLKSQIDSANNRLENEYFQNDLTEK